MRSDFEIGSHISFSPNACLAVALDGEWGFHLRYMEHPLASEDGQYDTSKFVCISPSAYRAD